jgi:hypothetical protein
MMMMIIVYYHYFKKGPDLSFAFCANRAGVTPKEIMDFDPSEFGQCLGRGGPKIR